ncbi:RimK family alpha-L-glutamate ligase [Streptomyces sp. B1I3]|uniref:RimK family alpha-L-glutamate ligase n=1 Tax=Streptomyces sp. B1I3 TaxID=3042264 RepID=UPI002787E582|nr:RimK family alpha-L-glutamate ligase [Streptomyces sp. B1I3]MDQ0791655.1 [lysine-biosynthesis-protein LysW]--L-2-aminoadipate ligase [Streptomyces sp. B1I3]
MTPQVVVLASRVRADEKRLFDALERRSVPYVQLDTRTLHGFAHPDRERPRPVVLNREISYARACYGAELLEAAGHEVVNSGAATALCGDKWRTSVALARAGLPTPRTVLALTPQAALDAWEELGGPAVIKPLVGSWGRLVTRVPDRATAEAVLEYVAALPSPQSHVVYLQELVEKPGRDIRVGVAGGEVIGAVYRRSDGWRTNVARGAHVELCEDNEEFGPMALAAAEAVGARIAGVDLIEDADGRPQVLEVNAGLEFSGLQRALGEKVSVADALIDVVLGRKTW